MIVVEQRLYDAFELLPEVGGFKSTYRWGNEYELLKLLDLFQKEGKSIYPLIYQVSNSERQDTQKRRVETDLSLIIAVQTNTELLNENRWEMNYKELLFPIAENIEQLFNKSQVFEWDGIYRLTKFPNYGSGKENFTIDFWDALRFDVNITINNNCFNEIFF